MSKARKNNSRLKREWPGGGLKVLHLLMGLELGGAERLLADALPRFPKERYSMEVVALRGDGPVGELLRSGGISVTALGGSLSRPAFIPRLLALLRSKKPHVLHTHLYWPGVLGRLIGRAAGIETIICHEHFLAREISARRRFIERQTWRFSNSVVAISEAVLKEREPDLPKALPRYVVYNGVPLDEISASHKSAARELLKAGEDDVVVGWVGRVDDHEKNITALLEAAKILVRKHPALKIMLVGDGSDRRDLERKSSAMGLDQNVRWLGARADARKLYAGMDIFTMPSRYEGLGMAIIEAMAAGVPVVATKTGGIPEVVVDGATGLLVPTGDTTALAEAISRLIEDRALRAKMGKAGRARAVGNYGIDKFITNMDSLYSRLWLGR